MVGKGHSESPQVSGRKGGRREGGYEGHTGGAEGTH